MVADGMAGQFNTIRIGDVLGSAAAASSGSHHEDDSEIINQFIEDTAHKGLPTGVLNNLKYPLP